VIIWATGFVTQDLLSYVDVWGHQGVRLKSQWEGLRVGYLHSQLPQLLVCLRSSERVVVRFVDFYVRNSGDLELRGSGYTGV
jgi:hypothetical protein